LYFPTAKRSKTKPPSIATGGGEKEGEKTVDPDASYHETYI
jgi:hypothetical protein